MTLLGKRNIHRCAPPISPGYPLLAMEGAHVTAARDEGKVWLCDYCDQHWSAERLGTGDRQGTFWVPISPRRARRLLR
jgi:hypothetical protein